MTFRPEILSSDVVPGFERISLVLGAVRCPRCPGARSAIPGDVRTSDDIIELVCPCGGMALLSVEPIIIEDDEENAP